VSKQKVGTKEFTKAVVERLGQAPTKLKPVSYKNGATTPFVPPAYHRPGVSKQLVGVDVMVGFTRGTPEELARLLQPLEADGLKLESIANRGLAVWPRSRPGAFLTDAFTCRFQLPDETKTALPPAAVVALLDRLAQSGVEFLQVESLCHFDGRPGFTRPFGG
jgi:isocitrate dehydrogenase